jgi:cyclopropane fatty-acyl-phospholipid synthase-like methyltransferase
MKDNNDLKSYGWLLSKFYTLMVIFSDNKYIIDEFKKRIDKSKKILELGSGPGNDYGVLVQDYDITGSDYSETFLKILRKKFNNDRFLKINALTMETEKKYDVIYSNKVLQHLTTENLATSFKKQYEVLNEGGILFHAMWKGKEF